MTEKKYNKNDRIKICGLWKKTASNGEYYLTGKWGDVYITIFKNGFKETENQPDWILYHTPVRGGRKPEERDQEFKPLLDETDD